LWYYRPVEEASLAAVVFHISRQLARGRSVALANHNRDGAIDSGFLLVDWAAKFQQWNVGSGPARSRNRHLLYILTPLTGFVSALSGVAIRVLHPHWGASMTSMSGVSPLVIVIAITLLGPGAFSLDAYFFGRRKIIVPRASNS
jgi:hypothetical protein